MKISETLYAALEMCTVKPFSLTKDNKSTKGKHDSIMKLARWAKRKNR